jgi:hypothetical protein
MHHQGELAASQIIDPLTHMHLRVCSLVISLLHTKRIWNSSPSCLMTSSTRVCSNTFLDNAKLTHYPTAVHKAQPGWRRVIAQAVLWGIPTPAFSTALAFFDGYRSEVLPANILQAQVCVALHLSCIPLLT